MSAKHPYSIKFEQVSEFDKSLHDAENRDRIRYGGAVCPRCGNRWDNKWNAENNWLRVSSIMPTQIKGLFRNYPANKCTECGYVWKMK